MIKQLGIALLGSGLLLSAMEATAQRQHPTPEQKQAAYARLRQLSAHQLREKVRAEHKRKPLMYLNPSAKKTASADASGTMKTTGATAIIPSDARFPGEYEEVQGVFISWSYTYDAVPVIDTISGSPMSDLYFQLANAIQKAGVKVYINVWDAADSTAVKDFMAKKGKALTNYKFLVYDGDDIWARDFGPVNYYYDIDDKIGWVDFHYYQGRDYDNLLPIAWGTELGIPVATSGLYQEGGNLLADGTQNLATSSAFYDQNNYYYGYSAARSRDSMSSNMRANRLDVLTALPHDGGTGHIDLYLDMTDENTFVHTKMPAFMASVPGFTDYGIANDNIDTLRTRKTFHTKPYRFFNIPFPTRDDGSWYTSASDYEYYTRTYSNHLIVNKTIIQPIFSNSTSGNAAGDAAAIDSIKKAYPGYTILPIDMRILDGSGGSIHCITKEFAAPNPLRFQHYAYRQLEAFQTNYPIDAIITNKSGITSAVLYWRNKGASAWNTVPMTSASGNHWLAAIPSASSSTKETFEYYISATSANGKTMTRPMPGADGPYEFWYDKSVSVTEHLQEGFAIGNLYPNPATDKVNMEVIVTTPLQLSLNITDLNGRKVAEQNFGLVNNTRQLAVNTSQLPAGVFMINVMSEGKQIATRKLIKK